MIPVLPDFESREAEEAALILTGHNVHADALYFKCLPSKCIFVVWDVSRFLI
jgi:hypothetical protein